MQDDLVADRAYRPQLDALRAIAVSGVLYAHFFSEKWELGSWGVRIFFVLSGYLITNILLREKGSMIAGETNLKSALTTFYARRVIRIFPAYYCAILCASLVHPAMRETVQWHALFASNFLFAIEGQYVPFFAAHLWSLSIEEQFYLLWPALILLMPPNFVRVTIIAMVVLGISSKLLLFVFEASTFLRWNLPTSSLDTLAVGALLATGVKLPNFVVRTSPISVAFVIALREHLYPGDAEPWTTVVFDSLALIPVMALVAGASGGFRGRLGNFLTHRSLVLLGRLSYGIYLYHLFVFVFIILVARKLSLPLPDHGSGTAIIAAFTTFAAAALSWRFLERPASSFKRLFPYPDKRTSTSANLPR